jgi:hypothetical protein
MILMSRGSGGEEAVVRVLEGVLRVVGVRVWVVGALLLGVGEEVLVEGGQLWVDKRYLVPARFST